MDARLPALPITADEAASLFAGLAKLPSVLLAVSGGPDSTALLFLAARWAKKRASPKLHAVTIDHAIRPEARREAAQVKTLARQLGVFHRTVRWTGPKLTSQEAARHARYELLRKEAERIGARHIVTAHMLEDQAETVLFRLARGSGVTGLRGIAAVSLMPGGEERVEVVRPLLGVRKVRLVATLSAAGIPFSDDPTNRDPRFARTRLRQLAATLADEGLTPARLALLAERMRRADETLAWVADEIAAGIERGARSSVIDANAYAIWPGELRVRVLAGEIERWGHEGSVELAKLEALAESLDDAVRIHAPQWRRTLAGASIAFGAGRIRIEAAPPRRKAAGKR